MPTAGFETAVPASELQQTHALGNAAIGIDCSKLLETKWRDVTCWWWHNYSWNISDYRPTLYLSTKWLATYLFWHAVWHYSFSKWRKVWSYFTHL